MFLIKNKYADDLWWNNEDGWGYCSTATVFSLKETDELDLPMEGEWVTSEGLRQLVDELNEKLSWAD